MSPGNTVPLLNNGHFDQFSEVKGPETGTFVPKKPFTCLESCVCCCVNICPTTGFDRDLRNKIAQAENDPYNQSQEIKEAKSDELSVLDKEPLIAYRGDTRSPKVIFNEGFSAYAPSRCYTHNCCAGDGDSCTSTSMAFTLLPPCLAFVGCLLFPKVGLAECLGYSAETAGCCGTSGVECLGCGYGAASGCAAALPISLSCCDYGQKLYKTTYISTWSALAFSLSPNFANNYMGDSSKGSYTYIVYLDGCIRFDLFSTDAIQRGAPDPAEIEGCRVFNALEVLPRDPKNQTVAPDRIIGVRNNNTEKDFIFFNNKFGFFNKLEPVLIAKGLDKKRLCAKMEIFDLEKILQKELQLKPIVK